MTPIRASEIDEDEFVFFGGDLLGCVEIGDPFSGSGEDREGGKKNSGNEEGDAFHWNFRRCERDQYSNFLGKKCGDGIGAG